MMKVLSLFDGMSCGQLALKKAGIPYTYYYASEIDKHAIKVSKENFPNMIHVGDVTKISGYEFLGIDLLIGGSPCQGFSFSGKQLNFEDPRSKLFFEFVRLLKEIQPKYFLLENVMMKKEYIDCITGYMGVEPVMINSALVSGQNRKRLYWTNIPGISQPEDRGILIEDILEDSECFPVIKSHGEFKYKPHKSQYLDANYFKGVDNHGQRTVIFNYSSSGRGDGKIEGRYTFNPKKSSTLTATGYSNRSTTGVIQINSDKSAGGKQPHMQDRVYDVLGKSPALTREFASRTNIGCIEVGHAEINGHDFLKRVYSPKGKSPTLTAISGGNQERKIAIDSSHWRKLTVLECKRLQTVPDDYKMNVSNSQAYKMLGNGWTVDVIAHIFKGIKDE